MVVFELYHTVSIITKIAKKTIIILLKKSLILLSILIQWSQKKKRPYNSTKKNGFNIFIHKI